MDTKFNGTTVETNGVRSIAGGGTGATTAEAARINLGLGTAAATDATAYATAAQGAKADSALQPNPELREAIVPEEAFQGLWFSEAKTLLPNASATTYSASYGSLTNAGWESVITRNANGSWTWTHRQKAGPTSPIETRTETSSIAAFPYTATWPSAGIIAGALISGPALSIADGGTGASTAEQARINLGITGGGVTSYNDLTDLPTLGTAAATSASDYATAAQGAKADTALQRASGLTYNGLFVPATHISSGKPSYNLSVPDTYGSTSYTVQWNPSGFWYADVEWRDDSDGYWRRYNQAVGVTDFPWQATWQANTGGGSNPAPTILEASGLQISEVIGLNTELNGKAPASHTHGSITSAGAIGSTSGVPIITGANGVLQAGQFGTAAGKFCEGNDSRLSDSRTPTSHKSSHSTGGADALAPADIGAEPTISTLPINKGGTGATTATAARTALGALSPQIDRFIGSNTWTKPSGAKQVLFECVAGGGGGGRGQVVGAGTAVSGGSGGGSGGYSRVFVNATELTDATYTVTVGSGGVGGTFPSGAAGAGVASSVSSATLGIFICASGAFGGNAAVSGGNSSSGAGGSPMGNAGGSGNITSTGGGGAGFNYSASAGGAGGGCSTTTPFAGGNGGFSGMTFVQAIGGAASTTGNGGNGGTTLTRPVPSLVINGGGGAGGGASTFAGASGGNGGNGAGFGSGGGGGGSVSAATGTGGNGGAGAPGVVVITTYF